MKRVTQYKYKLLARKSVKDHHNFLINASEQLVNIKTDCSFYANLTVTLKEQTSRQMLAHMQYLQILFKHNQTMYLPTLIARNTACEANDLLRCTVHCNRQLLDSHLTRSPV